MSALEEAYRYASPYEEGLEVEIQMYPGDHYILKSHVDKFKQAIAMDNTIDINNPTFSLTIKPHEEGSRPRIINKVGSLFKV